MFEGKMRRAGLFELTALVLSAVLAAGGTATTALAKSEKPPKPPGARLVGVVTDAQRHPLPGVKVVLEPLEGGGVTRTVLTGPGGKYEIEQLPHGLYDVFFEWEDRAYVGNRVLLVAPGRRLTADFRLGPFQPADAGAGLEAGREVQALGKPALGVGRLDEVGRRAGLAWLTSGKGVAVLVGGSALLVAAVIAAAEKDGEAVASPSAP